MQPIPTNRISATTAQLQDRRSSPRARNTCEQRMSWMGLWPHLRHPLLPNLSSVCRGETEVPQREAYGDKWMGEAWKSSPQDG